MADKTLAEVASKGGQARAKALSKQRRSEIARQAVEARWRREGKLKDARQATHDGTLIIGEMEIPCAVLDDETRVVSHRGFARALGASKPTAVSRRGAGKLPALLSAANLKPFIDNELAVAANIIPYRPKRGGGTAYGIAAKAIPKMCEVWLDARREGKLRHNQNHLAAGAEILIRGLAHTGIIALVDEATGYQEARARDALAKILEEFVAKELRKWVRAFEPEFYKEMFRLRGIPYDGSCKKPQYIGHITNDLVYSRLAPGVLQELRRKNPAVKEGKRNAKHHQWLTEGVGNPSLKQHLHALTAMMRASDNWDQFYAMLDRAFPPYKPMPLFEAMGVDLEA